MMRINRYKIPEPPLEPPEAEPVAACEDCGRDIWDGEGYYTTITGQVYCAECAAYREAQNLIYIPGRWGR